MYAGGAANGFYGATRHVALWYNDGSKVRGIKYRETLTTNTLPRPPAPSATHPDSSQNLGAE
jgi:hypothetical protein